MMSAEQLKSFLESASTDQDLRTKTQSASTIEELVAIAEQAGFSFSSDDFKAIELDDNELASVSGGMTWENFGKELKQFAQEYKESGTVDGVPVNINITLK